MISVGCVEIIISLTLLLGFLNEKDYNSQVTMGFQGAKVFC